MDEKEREKFNHRIHELNVKLTEARHNLKITRSELESVKEDYRCMQQDRDKWRTKHNLLFEYLYIGE